MKLLKNLRRAAWCPFVVGKFVFQETKSVWQSRYVICVFRG
jgi:hypothetical protein